MNEQNKATPKTGVRIETAKHVKTGAKKPLEMPAKVAHPRKDKTRFGKFSITEGSNKFTK